MAGNSKIKNEKLLAASSEYSTEEVSSKSMRAFRAEMVNKFGAASEDIFEAQRSAKPRTQITSVSSPSPEQLEIPKANRSRRGAIQISNSQRLKACVERSCFDFVALEKRECILRSGTCL